MYRLPVLLAAFIALAMLSGWVSADLPTNYNSPTFTDVAVYSNSQADPTGAGLAVAQAAAQYVGNLRYVWGGNSLDSGVDCSGFIQQLYQHYANTAVPRTAAQQYATGAQVSEANLQPGDLVFFDGTDPAMVPNPTAISHAGVYIGSGPYGRCTFIHAPHTGAYVEFSDLCSGYYQQHYAGATMVSS
jgi:cell wall-associated NlpC family hydrolase